MAAEIGPTAMTPGAVRVPVVGQITSLLSLDRVEAVISVVLNSQLPPQTADALQEEIMRRLRPLDQR